MNSNYKNKSDLHNNKNIISILGLALFALLLLNIGIVYAIPDITANYSNINESEFAKKLDDNQSIVFFFSDTCPHCKNVEESGILQNFSDTFNIPIHMINVAKGKELFKASCQKINNTDLLCLGIPTIIMLDVNKSAGTVAMDYIQGDVDIIKDGKKKIATFYHLNYTEKISNTDTNPEDSTEKNTVLTIITLLLTGLADSINPCIMSILALLIMQIAMVATVKRILKLGIIFIATIFISYLIIGIGILFISDAVVMGIGASLSNMIGWYVLWAIVLLLIFAAIVNIKDYFWYGKGLSFQIPKSFEGKIQSLIQKLSLPSILTLAALITIIEFPCSGFMYVGFVTFLKTQQYPLMANMGLLIVYNILFVLPLIIMVGLAYIGTDPKHIDSFRVKYRDIFRLIMGIALVLLAIFIIISQNLIQ